MIVGVTTSPHGTVGGGVRRRGIERVVTSGRGEAMRTTMGELGVVVRTDLAGDAGTAAVAATR